MTKTKTPPVRLALQIDEATDPGWSDCSSYYHINASPVIIGPNEWEATHPADYPDLDPERIRSCSDRDTVAGLYLSGLKITSQGGGFGLDSQETPHLYGWEVSYCDVYRLDLDKAEAFTKTLKTITRRMDKLKETTGRPTTFAQYVGYAAAAIGAREMLFSLPANARPRHDGRRHSFTDIAYGVAQLQRLESDWRERVLAGRRPIAPQPAPVPAGWESIDTSTN